MTGLEWVALGSLIINGWQFYDRGGLKEETSIYKNMAEQCQESKGNNRITELRSSDERTKQEAAIYRIVTGSKQHIRDIDKMGSDTCSSAVYPGGNRIVEESGKRTKAINSQWMRSTGGAD